MMDEGRHENEVRTDVKLLLDCLKCQVNNPTAVKQALLTLSSIFSACDFIKEYFKDIGGLTFLIDLLTSIENPEVQERAFFCLGCAIERNVFCQKSVTSSTVFKFIQTILSRGSTAKLKQTATFFLINLVANNGEGQVLVKQSQCLSTLMDLLCKALPKDMRAEGRDETGFDWFDDSGPTSIELWTSVVNALCVSINNPQNEENQKACGLQVPFIFKLLKQNRGIPSLTRPLMFLLGFIVSNNRSNQDQVRRCGGLDVLCLELQDQYYHSNDPELLKDVIQIITTIDSCIADNEESAKELGQAGVIQILAGVIHNEKLGIGERIKVTITLGHAIEHSVSNRSLFLEAKNGLQDLIHILTTCENEELTKAIKYVLQVTVQKDTNSDEEEWNQEITNKKSIGENILKTVNELANHLKSIEKEKELGGHLPTIIHTAQYNKNFDECPSTQDFVYTQPTLTFQNPNLLYLGNSVCKDANNNSSAFQISDDWKQQLSLTPFEKHLISELQKERLKNSDQTIRNHIACEPDKQKLVFERKEQVHEACTCTALEAEPGTHNYHNDDTEHRNSGCTSKIHVSNTRSLSSNSSTKSYDVDLTKMTDGKETKCTTVDGKIPLSEGIFKVPTCPPPKTQARCFRQVQSEPLCFPEAQGDTSFVESDAGFSDIQSEFDCKLLSGAADHKDGRMNPQATPVRQISVFPVERSNQQAYKTPEYQYSQRNTSNCSRNFLTTPTCSVKSVRSTLSSLKQDKTSGTDCSRQILHSKNSRLKMSCIGCTGTDCSDDTLLNSRTLNIVLETNPYTCQVHRQVRNIERSYIQKVKQQQRERPIYSYNKQDHPTNEKPSYDFSSESEAEVSAPDTIESRNSIVQTLKPVRKRRHRVPYSAEEVNNLLEGVDKIGKFWGQILATYKFHPSRTAVDLMEKFKRVSKSKEFSKNKGSLRKFPFSMCEERRLLKGVKQFGYSWKTILQSYKFASFRTTEDLRNKWRTLNA